MITHALFSGNSSLPGEEVQCTFGIFLGTRIETLVSIDAQMGGPDAIACALLGACQHARTAGGKSPTS